MSRGATRESNMELLRIVAMAMIVVFHASYKSGFEFEALTANTFGVKMLWMLGETGVNLFMMVSGYFLVRGRFRAAKLVSLVAEVGFYAALGIIVGAVTAGSGGGVCVRPRVPANARIGLLVRRRLPRCLRPKSVVEPMLAQGDARVAP